MDVADAVLEQCSFSIDEVFGRVLGILSNFFISCVGYRLDLTCVAIHRFSTFQHLSTPIRSTIHHAIFAYSLPIKRCVLEEKYTCRLRAEWCNLTSNEMKTQKSRLTSSSQSSSHSSFLAQLPLAQSSSLLFETLWWPTFWFSSYCLGGFLLTEETIHFTLMNEGTINIPQFHFENHKKTRRI